MTQSVPCINPTCDYVFPLKDIRGATAMTCPRCGTVCHLGGTAASSPGVRPPAPAAPRLAPASDATLAESPMRGPKSVGDEPTLTLTDAPKPKRTSANAKTKAEASSPAARKPAAATDRTATIAYPTAAPLAQRVDDTLENRVPPPAAGAGFHDVPQGETSLADFADDTPLSRARLERRRQPGLTLPQRIVLVIALGGLLVGLPLMAVLFGIISFKNVEPPPGDGNTRNFHVVVNRKSGGSETVCAVSFASTAWQESEDFKKLLKANTAFQQKYMDPAKQKEVLIVLAVAAQDYGQQKPTDAELLKQSAKQLENCFGLDLTMDKSFEEGKLDGKRALVQDFQGRINEVDYVGKCYALTHHGIGYWLFVMQTIPIGVDQGLADRLFTDLQKQKGLGFHTSDKREGWTEQAPEMTTYTNESKSLAIKASKGKWQTSPAKEIDAQGEIYLQSVEKQKYHKDLEKGATVLVLRLNQKTADLEEAVKAATEYVQARAKEANESFRLKPLEPGKIQGKKLPKSVGNYLGQLVEFELLSDDKDFRKFVLLAVVQKPEHVYVIHCESFWNYHQAWRGEFLDIIRTLKINDD